MPDYLHCKILIGTVCLLIKTVHQQVNLRNDIILNVSKKFCTNKLIAFDDSRGKIERTKIVGEMVKNWGLWVIDQGCTWSFSTNSEE